MTYEEAMNAIRSASGLDSRISEFLQPSIRLRSHKVELENLAIGASRLGGVPDLPIGLEWPSINNEPLSFLAQIRPSDFRRLFESEDSWPPGWLCFFYDTEGQPWGFDPRDRGRWRVVHFDCSLDELVRSKNPALKSTSRFHVSSIELELEFRLPTSELVCATLDQEFTKSQDELYEVLRNEVNGEESVRHGMFGWPDEVQGDMRLQCQLASNGIYCGDLTHYDHPRFAELEDGQQNWVLLLQIDTDEDGPGWMWGDCGRLYFWIHEVAFEACDFDNAWVVLQCY